MCFAESKRFDKEELSEMGWNEPAEPLPTEEELANQYFNYQWFTYKELFSMVEDAGGVLTLNHYTNFLLEELIDGPHWDNLGLELFYE